MAREIMTFIVCLDDHKSYTEDIRKRFSDTSRYTVESYHSQKEFLEACKKLIEPASCKVAIIGVPEAKDQYEAVEEMTMEIKHSDPRTGLILIVPPERMEDLKKVVRFNIDAYVA